jgi:CBS domain-containing protein
MMKVRETMTRDVAIASPDHTIADAALLMAEHDFGALPVGEDNRLVGMITDRDIALRAVAHGLGPDTPVHAIMTPDVKYCFDDEDTAHVARNMGDQRIRRLPVVNRSKQLVGILSLGDVAVTQAQPAGKALAGISRPGGPHSQSDGQLI